MTALALDSQAQAQAAGSTPQPAPRDDRAAWERCTQWEAAEAAAPDIVEGGPAMGEAPRPRIARSSALLGGLQCAACAGLIEARLAELPGVLEVQANAATARASLRWDAALTDPLQWQAALKRMGYSLAPDEPLSGRALRRAEARDMLWRFFVAALCSMQVMMLAAPSYVAEAPELSQEFAQVLAWGQWTLSLPVLLFAAKPLFKSAWNSLRRRRIAVELPAVLGIVVSFVTSTAAAFDPGGAFGSAVYFDSMTMFVAWLLAARWLEMHLRHRAAAELERGAEDLPQQAWRVAVQGDLERVERIELAQLRAGDTIQVPSGEALPADGSLLGGSAELDESMLSGEAHPVLRVGEGAALWAGSINRGPVLRMRVVAAGAGTRLAALHRLMRDAMSRRPEALRLADRWAGPFTVLVLSVALAAGLAWWFIEPARAWGVAAAVLIVTCPCALTLAVPTSLMAAAHALARRGLVVQRLQALDGLLKATHAVFDKTGTLTLPPGATSRASLRPLGQAAEAASASGDERAAAGLWAHALALAQASSHPVARELVRSAPARNAAALHDVEEFAGCGVAGFGADGARWQLGSADWLGAAEDQAGRVLLAREGRLLAAFDWVDEPRPEAPEAVAQLMRLGLQVQLLSGDRAERVSRLASRLGIQEARSSCSPQHKLEQVRALQQRGAAVLMVGDGLNDAPVLAGADVAVAMGSGSMASRVQADMVLDAERSGALLQLGFAVGLARRMRRIGLQNLAWAAAYNALSIPLALAGWLPPWAAGLGMASSSLLVVLNAARLTR